MDTDISRRLALYELLAKPDPPEMHRGFVVLHGTDTMAYTSSALSGVNETNL